jgi:acetyl/propionyl-CoA carboxylase alpha subunit
MAKELQKGWFRSLLPLLVAGLVSIAPVALRGQSAPETPSQSPAPAAVQPAEVDSATSAPVAVPNPAAVAPAPATPSSAAAQMTESLERLKQEGKLNSNREVAVAVRKVINDNSIEHEIPAPMGAKVIAVHKHPGDLVSVGDKIVTLLVNGKQVPIIAKQDGIMQTINVSKGGVIGNSRPRAAKAGQEIPGSILITLSPLQS